MPVFRCEHWASPQMNIGAPETACPKLATDVHDHAAMLVVTAPPTAGVRLQGTAIRYVT